MPPCSQTPSILDYPIPFVSVSTSTSALSSSSLLLLPFSNQDMPEGGLEIIISDTGIGIGPQDRGRIFEEYYQVHNPARDRRQGIGLGLAIVKHALARARVRSRALVRARARSRALVRARDRKSTRLHSSHIQNSRMPSSA